eukprot:TRINITY_DN10171_c0_g1_i3.p1 TRINITY_DN10171_c0_g1~~TRINITY_DN10171_c0_g1_i3.p1  ORF type:complete len:530 (-),score=57.98 TRINITY_DN10171_c0_g1_i3:197-1786(-)
MTFKRELGMLIVALCMISQVLTQSNETSQQSSTIKATPTPIVNNTISTKYPPKQESSAKESDNSTQIIQQQTNVTQPFHEENTNEEDKNSTQVSQESQPLPEQTTSQPNKTLNDYNNTSSQTINQQSNVSTSISPTLESNSTLTSTNVSTSILPSLELNSTLTTNQTYKLSQEPIPLSVTSSNFTNTAGNFSSNSNTTDDLDLEQLFWGDFYLKNLYGDENHVQLDTFYSDLYDEFYSDQLYGDHNGQDFQYYGDYGYYAVYNERGDLYLMNDVVNETQENYFKSQDEFCEQIDQGASISNTTVKVCDVEVTGADVHVQQLEGGLDGVYKVVGCHNGKPMYVRKQVEGQERSLWWSALFNDWDISNGTSPTELDILCYGGDARDEARPTQVPSTSWAIAAELSSQEQSMHYYDLFMEQYHTIQLNVTCVQGQVLENEELQEEILGQQPLLTDTEMEQYYRIIFEKYGHLQEPRPSINYTTVVVMVFAGMGVMLGIPYMFVRKAGKGAEKKGRQAMKMGQLQRKKRAGKL